MVSMPPLPPSRLPDWQRDPNLFTIHVDGVEVCNEHPWRVRFKGVASLRVPRLVEALQFDRLPENLGELFALMGYGGMLHAALLRLDGLEGEARARGITVEVRLASTDYPADHGAAMLAYLTGDRDALAEIHREYFPVLVSSMGNAIDDAVRWFIDNADEVRPPPVLQ